MILEVKDLHFSYQREEVLKGVSFSAALGDFICLLGENGAGKTTLFRCMLGLLKGYRGEIHIMGEPLKSFSVRELARRIAYIPQAHSPAFNYTVLQTVLMGTNARMNRFKTPGKQETKLANETLQQLGISHLRERGYAEISGGERQLVLIARALAQQSKVLIMDEPTANLDYGNQVRVMQQIRALAADGYLILLSTHNPEHALLYSHKVLVLRNGKTDLFGPTKEILKETVITEIYNIPVEVHEIMTGAGILPVCIPGDGSKGGQIAAINI
jgi:iron complex transport system ATP-binding protein